MNEQAIEDEAMAEDEFVEDYGEDAAEDLEDLMGGDDDGEDGFDFGQDTDEEADDSAASEDDDTSASAAAKPDDEDDKGRTKSSASRKRPAPTSKSSQAKRAFWHDTNVTNGCDPSFSGPKRGHINIEMEEEHEPATTASATR